ncbi:CbiQ family ECF transporter T component [Corynebacterium sp. H128]|uniref:CbiQ family ECF transporter T component n=1 Tax=unclassified Corynebacterium TaxID=2624378 RepID=UPI0030A2736C
MNALELAASRSRWAHINVGEKSLLIVLLFLAISVSGVKLAIIGVVTCMLASIAGVNWRLYAGLIAAPATFIAVGLGPLIFAITTSGVVMIPGGLTHAGMVLARSVVGMSITMLFALTTPMSEILMFARRCHAPEALIHVTALTYRLIGTLILTARAMWDAQAARLGHSSVRRWLRSVASQAASLFVLSFTRARALQEGLELRADAAAMSVLSTSRPVNWFRVIGALIGMSLICLY